MISETAVTKRRFRVTFCDERFYCYDIDAVDEDEAYEIAEGMALDEVPGVEASGSTYSNHVDTEELPAVVRPNDL
jgi:hypothetical protein